MVAAREEHRVEANERIVSEHGIQSNVNYGAIVIAGFALCIVMFITVYEVTLRYVFNAPTMWTAEVGRYLMSVSVFLSAAYTLQRRSHVAVEFVVDHLDLDKRRLAQGVCGVLTAIYCAVFVWQSATATVFAYEVDLRGMSNLKIPLLPVYLFMFLGGLLLLLQSLAQLLGFERPIKGRVDDF